MLAAYDDAVRVLTRIWHEWFSARIRLAAVALEALAPTVASMSAAERAAYLAHAERLHADGHTVLSTATPTRPGSGVRRVARG